MSRLKGQARKPKEQAGKTEEDSSEKALNIMKVQAPVKPVGELMGEAYAKGFRDGHKEGFGEGRSCNTSLMEIRDNAFANGVRRIVAIADRRLMESLGYDRREDMIMENGQPHWWQLTLLDYFLKCE